MSIVEPVNGYRVYLNLNYVWSKTHWFQASNSYHINILHCCITLRSLRWTFRADEIVQHNIRNYNQPTIPASKWKLVASEEDWKETISIIYLVSITTLHTFKVRLEKIISDQEYKVECINHLLTYLAPTISRVGEWREQKGNMKVLQLLGFPYFKHNRHKRKKPVRVVFASIKTYPVSARIQSINDGH